LQNMNNCFAYVHKSSQIDTSANTDPFNTLCLCLCFICCQPRRIRYNITAYKFILYKYTGHTQTNGAVYMVYTI
jgi:hypothetical protein